MEEQLALEQRVWQRVRSQGDPQTEPEEDLARLIRLGREQVCALQQLDRHLSLRELENLQLLTALYHLRFGKKVPVSHQGQPGRAACRRRAEEMLQLYIRLERDPEFSALFTRLTGVQRAVCAALGGR